MKKLLLLALTAAALGACQKNDDNAPVRPADLLTAHNWRISAQTTTSVSNGKTVVQDNFATAAACERDNFSKFNADKSLVVDEGPTKCDPSDAQRETGSWDFNGDQTKLTIGSPALGGLLVPFDVVALSGTTLHLRYTDATGPSPETEDITFTAF